MSNEKINRALHSAIGRGCWHESGGRDVYGDCCRYCQKYFNTSELPDYCASLDAVAEAEAFVIETVGGYYYFTVLAAVVDPSGSKTVDTTNLSAVAAAPALDRAKACLAALGQEV